MEPTPPLPRHLKYQLVYRGEVLPGFDLPTVRLALRRAMKLDDAHTQNLFSGRRVVLRHAVSAEAALRYEELFARLGARLRVEDALTAPPGTPPAPRPPEAELALVPVVSDTLAPEPPAPAPVAVRRPGAIVVRAPALDDSRDTAPSTFGRVPQRAPDARRRSQLAMAAAMAGVLVVLTVTAGAALHRRLARPAASADDAHLRAPSPSA